MRRFRRDALPNGTLDHLIEIASLAPSVGLCEPWRFVVVEDPARRAAIRANFERENLRATNAQSNGRAALYARLKLEGMDAAPVQFAILAEPEPRQGYGLGRRTMPETAAYSAVLALHTLWLAARAEGLGLGWVSILDPIEVARILDVPEHWVLIGYFCLGYAIEASETPELERLGWERRRPSGDRILQR